MEARAVIIEATRDRDTSAAQIATVITAATDHDLREAADDAGVLQDALDYLSDHPGQTLADWYAQAVTRFFQAAAPVELVDRPKQATVWAAAVDAHQHPNVLALTWLAHEAIARSRYGNAA